MGRTGLESKLALLGRLARLVSALVRDDPPKPPNLQARKTMKTENRNGMGTPGRRGGRAAVVVLEPPAPAAKGGRENLEIWNLENGIGKSGSFRRFLSFSVDWCKLGGQSAGVVQVVASSVTSQGLSIRCMGWTPRTTSSSFLP